MLRLVPVGPVVGPVVGLAVGPAVGPVVGVCGVQLPFDTWRPLLAPAVWVTTDGTQLAASRLYGYGMLMDVLDTGLGPAGWFSVPAADQVTLSKMLPLTCQEPIRSV